MRRLLLMLVLLAMAAPAAAADVVTQWNDVLIDCLRIGHPSMPGPGWSSRNMAIVHGAIYDAVNSVDRTHTPFKVDIVAPAGTSKHAAAAQAAYTVLSNLYPAQQATFNTALATSLSQVPDGPGKANGIALGTTVGSQMLAVRANDHAADDVPYTIAPGPGIWRPMPPLNASALGPGWGLVTPFCMPSGSQFRPIAPPAITSAEYAASFNEVKSLGAKNSTTRTPEQTEIGVFWGYDRPGTGAPPVLYNQIARKVADLTGNTMEENARMFALVNMAQADAGITSWEAKYTYNYWRPIEAIREANLDGNPLTEADPTWEPLGAPGGPIPGGGTIESFTPPFPAYVSGHATFGAASMKTLANFYGTNDLTQLLGAPLTLGSDELPGVFRTFTSFEQMAVENARSRIYLGIHWDFDDEYGRSLGNQVANLVTDTMLVAVPEPSTIALAAFALIAAGWCAAKRRRVSAGR
jgi:hypothetical protein